MSNQKMKSRLEELISLSPTTFMDADFVKAKFLSLYMETRGNSNEDEAEAFYEKETFYLKNLLSANPEMQKCTVLSLYGCFLDVVINGLSFDASAKLMYLLSRNVNVAKKGEPDRWEKRAYNEVSPYGELLMRINAKQINYVDDPVVVYAGDTWEPGYNEYGNRYCLYRAKLPHDNADIIGSFIKITRTDGSFDFPFFTKENISEWQAASKRQNKGNANALYGSDNTTINIGFLKAKTIKHAFKTYPKIKVVGTNTQLEDEAPLPPDAPAGSNPPPETPAPPAANLTDESFLTTPAKNNHVQVTAEDDLF